MTASEPRAVDSQSWIEESAWSLPVFHAVGDLIHLSHIHFLATRSPLFWIRALRIGRHLSPDDGRLAWARDCARDCLAGAIERLGALIDRPPEKGKHWDAIIEAFGFSMGQNYNPFREVHKILERDKIYVAVRQRGKPLTGDKAAFQTVAKEFGVSDAKVKEIYYATKKLVDRLAN